MNGTRFVVSLACLAVAASAIIVLGAPDRGPATAAEESAAGPSGDPVSAPSAGAAAPPSAMRLDAAIDSSVVASADSSAAWDYRRTAVADFDGDAVPERLVLAADVYVTDDGEPMWEDAHRWAVYVEEDDGRRTLVYSAFVPLGVVSAGATARIEGAPPRIVVMEQGPHRARLMLMAYDSPGRLRVLTAAGAETDLWADRVAEETR